MITRPAWIHIRNRQMELEIEDQEPVSIPLEDIGALVLDNPRISLSMPLLCQLAEEGIALLTVDEQHLPNGILLPFQQHFAGLQRLRAQLALSRPRQKQWHQQIVQQKILNQAETLSRLNKSKPKQAMLRLAQRVRSGDPDNLEGQAARLYFEHLHSQPLRRRQPAFINSAINYGYSVLRSAIARSLAASGLHPALGLFHNNERNPFNLADDLIEPYRPLLDYWVLTKIEDRKDPGLLPADKGTIVSFVHHDTGNNHSDELCSTLAHIEQMVSRLGQAMRLGAESKLWLATHPSKDKQEDNIHE